MGSKGSKAQRQNQHMKRLVAKIKRFERRGKSAEGLKKELAFILGDAERAEFKTGRDADPRFRKRYSS